MMGVMTDTVLRDVITTDSVQWEAGPADSDKLLITSFSEDRLTPVGYDLALGERFVRMYSRVKQVDRLKPGADLVIRPGEIVALETEEYIGMPKSRLYSGILVSKVSIVERGLSHISTSLDPDWHGKMVITLANHAHRNVVLKRGQPFCTVIFLSNVAPSTKPCGKNPDMHINALLENWKYFSRSPSRVAFKVLVSFAPIAAVAIKYMLQGVDNAEVALAVAVSVFALGLLDRFLPTD